MGVIADKTFYGVEYNRTSMETELTNFSFSNTNPLFVLGFTLTR